MATNPTEILGITSNKLPTGTYIGPDGHTLLPIVDEFGTPTHEVTYEGATNTTSALTLNGIYQAGTVLTVTDTLEDPLTGAVISTTPLTVTQGATNGTSTAFTVTTATNLSAGDHHFTATATNPLSGATSTDTFEELVRRSTSGATVPNAPTLSTIADAHDTSGTASPNIIASTGLVFSGTADPYALITVYVGTSQFGGGTAVADQVQADASGHWVVTQDASRGPVPETSGQLTYVQVTATDLAGNSASNATTSYVVDTTSPTLAFTAVNYTDSSGGSHDTNVSAVSFSGTVSDDHTVDSVVVNTMTNGVVTGHITATVNADGTWTASGTLANEGVKSYTVTATDEAGNQTTTGNATTFTYDHTAPTVTNEALTYDNTDLVTHSTTVDQTRDPSITLTATVNDALSTIKSVAVFDSVNGAAATQIGTETIVSGTGAAGTNTNYSATLTLTPGTHVIHEVVTDIAGNVTTEPTYTPLTVDMTAPTIASTTETYGTSVGTHIAGTAVAGLTNDPAIHIAVTTTDAGGDVTNDGTGISSVKIVDSDGTIIGNAAYSGSGNVWTYDTSSLSQGTHTLHAVVTDAVGNVTSGTPLAPFTIDTIAPAQPTVALTTDSGSSAGDRYTNNDALTATTDAAGNIVKFYIDNAAPVAATSVAVTTGGVTSYVATYTPTLANGVHYATVSSTDPAGNISTPSAMLAFTYDTVAPVVAVTNTTPPLNASGATLNASHATATFSVAFDETPKNADGSAHAVTASDFTFVGGNIVSVVQGTDAQHYTVTVQNTAAGNAITDTLTYKAGEVFDQAGNTNVAASATATGDTMPPAAPIITNVDATLGQSLNALTTAVTVSGTVEANAVVTIYDAEQHDAQNYPVNGTSTAGTPVTTPVVVGMGQADATGHYSIALTAALTSDETHVLSATATDAASNVSGMSATAAAAVLSPADTYAAASALNKGVAAGTTTPAIAGAGEYFVVGDANTYADLINGGRASHEVINDEYTYNSTITVGTSAFTLVRGGVDATITAGSGHAVFAISSVLGASASPESDPQTIHGFNSFDKIDVSSVMTSSSSIEIDQTAGGSTLIVHNGIGGDDTVVNVVGSSLTGSQVITATADHDYYLGTAMVTTPASLITSVALDGTTTEIATGDLQTYGIALDAGTGYITHGSMVAGVTSVDEATFANGTLYFDPNGAAADVYRTHLAAFGTAASADDLATGVAFLSSGHTVSQLAADYLASPTLEAESTLTNQQFVDQTYQDAFGRAADAGGETYWTNMLNNGESRADLITTFEQAAEAHFRTDATVTHGLFAQDNTTFLYEILYDRDPTPSELAAGQATGLNQHDLAVQLVSTPMFTNAVTGMYGDASNQHIVDYLYESVLHRPADSGGEAYWASLLGYGVSPADVALAFASSAEGIAQSSYQQALSNGATTITDPTEAGELVKAIFGTAPSASDPHFTSAVTALQHGTALADEAQALINVNPALNNPSETTVQFVDAIFMTALGRPADAGGEAFWTDQINNHGLSKAAFVVDAINSVEFQSHFDPHASIVAAATPAVLPT